MKNFLSYSLIIILSSIFIFTGIKETNFSNSVNQIIKANEHLEIDTTIIDTTINRLPEGYQFISNFKLKKNKKTIAISQDSSGVMLFLNSKSVIFFDGKNETELFIENIPNTLKKDKNLNQFYVACKEGFGLLKQDFSGNYTYETLSDINTIDNFFQIIVEENKVWFVSEHKIVSLSLDNNENNIEYFSKDKIISGAFIFNNKLYLSQYDEGLQLLEKETPFTIIKDSLFSNFEIVFSVPFKGDIILGMGDNKLYSFNGTTYTPLKTSSEDYIKESIITEGFGYNNKELVILTLNGGVLIINNETGETVHTINYRTGLPDDEVFTGKVCDNGGLWLSHDYGVSRIAFDIPVTNYGYYPGLVGKINSVTVFDSTLYVATGEGLFKLSEIQSLKEIEVATTKRVKARVKARVKLKTEHVNNTSPRTSGADIETLIDSDDAEEGGFFSRWKNRRKKKNEEKGTQENNGEIIKNNTKKSNTYRWAYKTVYKDVVEYRKMYELQSVKYSYKKIKEINSKCRQLKAFSGGLLASSNSGLFYIENNNVQTIIPDAYIFNISGKKDAKVLFVSTSEGIFKLIKTTNKIITKKVVGETIKRQHFKNVYKINNTTIWANTLNNIFKLELNGLDVISTQKYNIGSEQIEKLTIIREGDRTLFFTSSNVFYYNKNKNDIVLDKDYNKIHRNSDNIFLIADTSLIFVGNKSLLLNINTQENLKHLKYAWIVDEIENVYTDDANNIWVSSSDNSIYKISDNQSQINADFKITIKSIIDNKGSSYSNFSRIQLSNDYKDLKVKLSSPYYLKKDFVTYLYGIDSDQAERFIPSSSSNIVIPQLNTGEHTIYFQAINDLNERSEILEIHVNINPPFWKNIKFIIAVFLVIMMIVFTGVFAFFRRKQRRVNEYNQMLELKVKERTVEIQEQNNLIQIQNNEIYTQYEKINHQNEEITSSIRYAGRIQKAALPNTDIQEKYISGYFNLFKPRDIVSGDFYWMSEAQNKLLIAAVDCTGHGVPGGFLSMLGISFLNEIVRELNREGREIKASNILNILRSKIIGTLSKQGDEITRDGMDMSLVIIDKENMVLNYAGANNPIYITRKSVLTKIDADRMPIGYNHKLNNVLFTNRTLEIEKDDLIYLFSDGYSDQFGGKYGKKFNSRRFRELLSHMEKHPMQKQREIAGVILNKWMGDNDQVDDILLIGIKI